MKKIAILGVTGSVGRQTLEVALAYPEEIKVVCISAHTHAEELAELANAAKPEYVVLTGKGDVDKLKSSLTYDAKVVSGKDALKLACTLGEPDLVALSVLGIAGLPAFEECLKNRITVALANKESLVCGGEVTKKMIDETGTLVLPVDSEHSAIFQCLGQKYHVDGIRRIWVTASGGPFLEWEKERIYSAPKESALKHPRWDMGQKITIDSASLANKGLEVIEAHYMYRIDPQDIKVLVHPQSMVHSMVEFSDCSLLAQMGPVDMKMPIQKALLYPQMMESRCFAPLDFYEISRLDFIEPDMRRFPCLKLAYDAMETQTTAVFNTANEAAVDLYLKDRICFGRIPEIIEDSMHKFCGKNPQSIEEILSMDTAIREYVMDIL